MDEELTGVVDSIAEEIYDFACANRADNVDKKTGAAGDPRKVGCKFSELYDEPKNFYRNIAKWHLQQPWPAPMG